jgi:hypothetical protein
MRAGVLGLGAAAGAGLRRLLGGGDEVGQKRSGRPGATIGLNRAVMAGRDRNQTTRFDRAWLVLRLSRRGAALRA